MKFYRKHQNVSTHSYIHQQSLEKLGDKRFSYSQWIPRSFTRRTPRHRRTTPTNRIRKKKILNRGFKRLTPGFSALILVYELDFTEVRQACSFYDIVAAQTWSYFFHAVAEEFDVVVGEGHAEEFGGGAEDFPVFARGAGEVCCCAGHLDAAFGGDVGD